MSIILDRVERQIDADLRRQIEAEAMDVRLAPQRELESRIAEGERRHAEIVAQQAKSYRPIVVDDARRKFWESVKAQAEAAGVPFEMPSVPEPEATPAQPTKANDQSAGPSRFGASFLDRETMLRAARDNMIADAERLGLAVPADLLDIELTDHGPA